jgi:hypothetical protein
MPSQEILVTFPEETAAKRSQLASSLYDVLSDAHEIGECEIKRERPDTQDSGTILSIVLSAPAIVLAVNKLAAWLTRNNQAGLTITLPDGKVVVRNLKSEDVPKAIDALKAVVHSD